MTARHDSLGLTDTLGLALESMPTRTGFRGNAGNPLRLDTAHCRGGQ
jgi:hypothetical protein